MLEADRMGFFERISEDPLRKGVFAMQGEGERVRRCQRTRRERGMP